MRTDPLSTFADTVLPANTEEVAAWQAYPLNRTLGEHTAAWDDLNERLLASHPLLSSAFVNGLLRHFGDGSEQLFIGCAPGGTAQAMCILRRRNRWMWETFRPAQAQVGMMLLRGPAAARGLLQALPKPAAALDLMSVDPALSGLLEDTEPALRLHHAQTMNVALTGGLDAFWANRSASLQQNLRRYKKRALADGLPFRHVCLQEPAAVSQAVARYAELEQQGWKGREGTAVTLGTAQGQFYAELLHGQASVGAACVHELWMADRLAASRLVLQNTQCLVMLKTTYDEALSTYAPGRVLLKRLLAHAFEHHEGATVEFYTDATQDQLTWATGARAIYNLRLYAKTNAGLTLRSGRTMRAALRPAALPEDAELQVQFHPHAAPLPADLHQLFEQAALQEGPQCGADWYQLLAAEAFAADHEVGYFALRRGKQVLAALPLMWSARAPDRIRALSGPHTGHFSPPMQPWISADDLLPLVHAVRQHWPRAATLRFGPMHPASREYALLGTALERSGLVPLPRNRVQTGSLLPQGRSWTECFSALDDDTRETVSRMSGEFQLLGGTLEVIQTSQRLAAAGAAALERVCAEATGRAGPHWPFVRAVTALWAERGWLRLGVAWLGGQPVAAQAWVVAQGRAEIFKLAHTARGEELAAGALLTAHLMQRALDHDHVHVVESLANQTAAVQPWMDRRGERATLEATSPRSVSGLMDLMQLGTDRQPFGDTTTT